MFGTKMMLALTVLSLLVSLSSQYHFSNGWNAGRKRSGSLKIGCMLKPQIRQLYLAILKEEINQLMTACSPSDSMKESPPRILDKLLP